MRLMILVVMTVALGALAIKAEAEPLSTSAVELEPGETYRFFIRTDQPLMVGFGFELGTVARRTKKTCIISERSLGGLPHCGRVVQVKEDGSETYTYVSSMHGGAIKMKPEDGVIRARLESMALIKMAFIIKVKEID